MTGVYGIENTVNGKVYVGSASKSLVKRMAQHRYSLNKNEHYNKHLQDAWNKYGSESFHFFIIDEYEPEKCLQMEQHWINTFESSNPEKGYNLCKMAGSPLGLKHTAEAVANMSAASKGKKKSLEHAANIKAAKQNMTDETKSKMAASAKLRSSKHYDVLKKLTDEQVIEIREAAQRLVGRIKLPWMKAVAIEYGVSLSCIRGAAYGWKRQRAFAKRENND